MELTNLHLQKAYYVMDLVGHDAAVYDLLYTEL